MSKSEHCCDHPVLQWESRQIVDRFADVLACASCRRTHKVEDWAISILFPAGNSCVNCGGELASEPISAALETPGRLPDPTPRCSLCSLSPAESRQLHDKLARLHPSGLYVDAAEGALLGGRVILAFKLATAQLAYGRDDRQAREIRLQGLESLGLIDEALAEAWTWFDRGGPVDVLRLVAGLEAAKGNLESTIEALERGLRIDPQNLGMWTDYAELQSHLDDREGALGSAGYGLGDPDLTGRCLEVIANIAESYYSEDHIQQALDAVNRAGSLKQESVKIAWLTARIAAQYKQWEESQAWLEVTLRLDPEHQLAREALARIKPRDRKKGWFGWLGTNGPNEPGS